MPVFVGGLVLGTSAAVAAVAWWLVPPYLALMAFLLLEPAGRRVSATNPAGPRSASSGASASGGATDPAESAGSGDSSASNDAAPAPKARRGGKGRGSRKAKPAFEPAPAAWLQVAPGKFVRVEPGSPTGESGPYASLPPGTPMSSPSPAEAEAVPGLDAPDRPTAEPGPHDAPTEAALEYPHLETTPAEGLEPDSPRDPEPAVVGWPLDDDARAESSAFDHDVTPDPGIRPSLTPPASGRPRPTLSATPNPARPTTPTSPRAPSPRPRSMAPSSRWSRRLRPMSSLWSWTNPRSRPTTLRTNPWTGQADRRMAISPTRSERRTPAGRRLRGRDEASRPCGGTSVRPESRTARMGSASARSAGTAARASSSGPSPRARPRPVGWSARERDAKNGGRGVLL